VALLLNAMMGDLDTYVYCDQPATCYKCGARTGIIWEDLVSEEKPQMHYCPNPSCGFMFLLVEDPDFDDGSLL